MSTSKQQKLGEYEWSLGEEGVTVVVVQDPIVEGMLTHGVSSIIVPKKKLPYYAKVAMFRGDCEEKEFEWNITNPDVAEAGFLEHIETCDYDAWKDDKEFTEDSLSHDEDTPENLSDDQREEVIDDIKAWYIEMRKEFKKMAPVPILEVARIFLIMMEERAE